jgi:hypothetical protein
MPSWIYLCCRKSVSKITAARLLRGIKGDEPEPRAGVDYLTLAEDYPVGKLKGYENVVEESLRRLEVAAQPDDIAYEVSYADWPARPIAVHRWDLESAGSGLLDGILQKGAPAVKAATFKQLIGIRLSRHHLGDMGIVFAYEVARYLGQLGRALVLNDQGDWQEIEDGEWQPTGVQIPKGFDRWCPADEQVLAEARTRPAALKWLLGESHKLFFEFDGRPARAAALLASLQEISSGEKLPALLDGLVDDAMDCQGMNEPPSSVARLLHELIGSLPTRRAESLVAPTGVRWRFVLDCPTLYVVERAVHEVHCWPRVTNMYVRSRAIVALPRLGAIAVGPLIQALAQRCPQRIVLLASLAAIGAPEGLETLLTHLADPLERVRMVAEWGLERLGPEQARERLSAVASAKNKPARESAERLLQRWGKRKVTSRPRGTNPRWCAGCGLIFDDHDSPCTWCGAQLESVPSSPWRAIASPACPVDLQQA